MSGFAGVFSFSNNGFDKALKNKLSALINRKAENKVYSYFDNSLILFKFDVQAYPFKAWREDGDGITCVAGDPVFTDISDNACNRELATKIIRDDLSDKNLSSLAQCRGSYCGASYYSNKKTIFLFSDKLGLRPIYYTFQGQQLYFSTALRVLEELGCIQKEFDIRGAIEYAVFDYCLDDHTGYKNIHSLEAGSCLTFNETGVNKTLYWSLVENIRPFSNNDEGLNELYQQFSNAVTLRLGDATKVNALLSGGLDSRCVVTELWKRGIKVDSFTFGDPQTLDCKIAQEYANELGLNHTEKKFMPCDFGPGWPMMIANEIKDNQQSEVDYSSPRLIWSGDGGSVSAGRVYLDESLVRYLDNANYRQAAQHFSKSFKLYILKKKYQNEGRNHPTQHIENILREMEDIDPINRFLLFLMANDQRRHLEKFFENIDLYGVDFSLPFYDAEFIRIAMGFDSHYGLYHQMYNDWLKYFPSVITKVTWQHYPGHLPSPLPLPNDSIYQWSRSSMVDSRIIKEAKNILLEKQPVFDKRYLLLCILLTQFKIRDMSWLLQQVCKIYHFARVSNN